MQRLPILAVALLATGCGSTYQAYQGATRPISETATVEISGDVKLVSADGHNLNRDPLLTGSHVVTFLPGDHWVRIKYTKSYTQGGAYQQVSAESDVITINLPDLRAGHRYSLSITISDSRLQTHLADLADRSTP
jgi:hypothetical protein